MELKQALGFLAVALSFVNLSLYMRTIVAGKTKPHAFSWLLWAIVMGVVFLAQFVNQAGAGSWQTLISAGLCAVVAALAFRQGDQKATRSDWIALLLSLSAIPLWMAMKDPLLAIILLTAIDAAGFYPTFRKAYFAPFEENLFRPFRAAIVFTVAVLALEHYTLTTYLYPVSLIVIELLLGMMLLWRRASLRT